MRKLSSLKGFFLGIITCLIISICIVPAIAVNADKNAVLNYRDINITIDGKKIIPMDANGNVVEPFAINGTTYLPVRAVASVFGLNATWDAPTSSVVLTSGTNTQRNDTQIAVGTVLINKDNIKITYLGLKDSSSILGGKDLALRIDNESTQDIVVQIRDSSVNGFMCEGMLSCNVAAGKSAFDNISYWQSALDKIYATSITSVEFKLLAYNADTLQDIFLSDIISLTF